ncbi:MAG TPA: FAD:protein FMN transferase, partial [Rhizobacter sp.]
MNAARRVIVPLQIAPDAPALGACVHTLQGQSMGTTWCVKLSGPRHLKASALQRAVEETLGAVVAQMSPWETGSAISRFNRAAAGEWHTLPAEFSQVMGAALQVAGASGGAFDPTAGELVNLWGFGPPGPVTRAPAPEALDAARARAGWQRLTLQAGRLRQPGGATLDLSAIAKGFAVDQIARLLHARGFGDHLVEVGGELRGSGLRPDGQPWWVDLQLPP